MLSLRTSAALLCAALTSCATSRYERLWKSTLHTPAPAPSGCWEGQWRSEANGHNGKLRCIVRPSREGYQFHYQATWAKFLTGEFSIQCPLQPAPANTWKVTGSKDLGPTLGGTFTHEAVLTPAKLDARYNAKFDHGTMHLHRAKSGPQTVY
jgi:hypothetical protein